MTIPIIAISIFLVLEGTNVLMLYFNPGSKLGNGIGVFNAWEKSKQDDEVHQLVKYLVNWVAGTKLIFIMLLLVIIFTGTDQTQLYALVALIVSILSFFWRLYPSIRKMDIKGQITPKGYSKTLGVMIGVFIAGFTCAWILTIMMN